MIVMDTETTGLTQPELSPLDAQPHMLEFCGYKLDDKTLEEKDCLTFLCNPGIIIPDFITKINGITNEMVKNQPTLRDHFPKLAEFFLGERIMVAHNLPFDRDILRYNLMRIGKVFHMPWAPQHICTAEISQQIYGKRRKLEWMYEDMFKKPANQKHRAKEDTLLLVDIVRELRRREAI